MKISVVLPAYKESENLKVLLPKITDTLRDMEITSEILVVDTMQPTDDTSAVCKEAGAVYLHRRGGDAYGDAIRTGVEMAQGEWVVVMDSDGSHDPKDIPRLYEQAQDGYDVVIGSRYTRGGDSHNGFILKSMSFMVNFVYRFVFGIKVKDVSDSFRVYQADRLKALSLSCDNFDIVEEILILFNVKYMDFRVTEVPIYFNKRVHGESKRDLVKFIFSYISSIVRLWKIKKRAEKHISRVFISNKTSK